MDNVLFEQLMSQRESSILDFKTEQYKIFKKQCQPNNEKKQTSEFIKDILCMANNPRRGSAYIIIGIKEDPKTLKRDYIGCNEILEEANIQEILKNNITPMVTVEYYPFTYTGDKYIKNMYQIYEIKPVKVNEPYKCKKNIDNILDKEKVYCRDGSRNAEADNTQIDRIKEWGKSIQEDYEINDINKIEMEKLKNIYTNINNSNVHVLLIDSVENIDEDIIKYMTNIKWDLIIDFDSKSKSQGFYKKVYSKLSEKQSIKELIDKDTIIEDHCGENLVRWYPINGLEPYDDVYNIDDFDELKKWKRINIINLRKMLQNMRKENSRESIKIIMCLENLSNKEFFMDEIDQLYQDNAEYIIINKEECREKIEGYDVVQIKLNKREFFDGIREITKNVVDEEIKEIRLPKNIKSTQDRSPCTISLKDYRWIEEELELVHLDILSIENEINKDSESFYKGNIITWGEIALHYDIDRSITENIKSRILLDLNSEKTTTINLFYIPGAGATTIVRRLAWNIHTKYPTILIKSISKLTIERIVYLAEKTSTPIFAIIDNSVVKNELFEVLYGEILARLKNVVFLRVQRTDKVKDDGERSFYLDSMLDRSEMKQFMIKYNTQYPELQNEFKKIDELDKRFKTPFYFGFIAYKKKFVFIPKYVEERISNLTDMQKKIVMFITIVYYFGHKLTPAYFFREMLEVPEKKDVMLENVLSVRILELFVCDENQKWRPIHSIIAEEILDKLHHASDGKVIWEQKLSDWGRDIINICKNIKYGEFYHNDVIDILTTLFIDRGIENIVEDDIDSDKNKFSSFIETIPYKEGKLTVFEYLVDNIKEQTHFIAHKARLYLYVFNDCDKALKCINKAIGLDEVDASLHHIKGTIISTMFDQKSRQLLEDRELSTKSKIDILREIYDKAVEEFKTSIYLEKDNVYAYTSNILLNIRVVQYGYKDYCKSNNGISKSQFMSKTKIMWFAEALQNAENLIYEVKKLKFSAKSEVYIKTYENSISEYYKDYSVIIQNWTNLLDNKLVYAPSVRRQIIRAYYSKCKNNWENAYSKDLNIVIGLIEENINQEPENVYNINRWFNVYRYMNESNINKVIEKFKIWEANSPSVESAYYIYVLNILRMLVDNDNIQNDIEESIRICRNRAIDRKNRTYSYEWYGKGNGLNALISSNKIDLEKIKNNDFSTSNSMLKEVVGRIQTIKNPANGSIKFENGLNAFFIPMQANAYKGKDEGKEVKCYISFSYDGVRAHVISKIDDNIN